MLDVRRGPEPSDRQKAMVLQAFVDDLSFWGDLTSVAATSTPTSTSTRATPSGSVAAVATKLSPTQLQVTKEMRTTASNSSWKTAVDAASGKTYYYDVVTRRTQWEKVSCHGSLCDQFFMSLTQRICTRYNNSLLKSGNWNVNKSESRNKRICYFSRKWNATF